MTDLAPLAFPAVIYGAPLLAFLGFIYATKKGFI